MRHAGGDQVHDGRHLPLVEAAAGIEIEHHRCARLLLLAHEHRALGQGQVHARALDVAQIADGARQLALQGVLIARRLDELAGAEALILAEHLEAVAGTLRQAVGGQLQARLLQFRRRHHQRAAGLVDLERDVGLLQGLGDRRRVALREIAVEQAVTRRLRPQRHCDAQRHAGRQADHQPDLPQCGKPREAADRLCFYHRHDSLRSVRLSAGSGAGLTPACS